MCVATDAELLLLARQEIDLTSALAKTRPYGIRTVAADAGTWTRACRAQHGSTNTSNFAGRQRRLIGLGVAQSGFRYFPDHPPVPPNLPPRNPRASTFFLTVLRYRNGAMGYFERGGYDAHSAPWPFSPPRSDSSLQFNLFVFQLRGFCFLTTLRIGLKRKGSLTGIIFVSRELFPPSLPGRLGRSARGLARTCQVALTSRRLGPCFSAVT